jgi:phenylacetic acid degradation operon negative regulatory protein
LTGQRPQDLVFTLFGEYLLDVEAVWVGSLIGLLEPFGLTAGSVRTVLSRMSSKGWLETSKRGKHSFYSLTPKGRGLLEEGQARIFRPTWASEWDGSWLLLAYSLPQDARRKRDRLRDRLAWLGFGSIGNGLWISPRDVGEEVTELARRMGITERLVAFRATRIDNAEPAELVARCWDVEALDSEYLAFATRWESVLAGLGAKDGDPSTDVDYFVMRFQLIHQFRRFPLEDPFLPRALLPEPWGGDRASEVFLSLHDRLVGPADRWVADLLASAPDGPRT